MPPVPSTGSPMKAATVSGLAVEIETLARQYYLSLALDNAQILPDVEIARVIEKFKNYGPRQKPAKTRAAE